MALTAGREGGCAQVVAERPTPAPAPQQRRLTDDAIEDEVGDEEMYDDEFDDE